MIARDNILDLINDCIVPGQKKRRFAELHKKLETDRMAHVYIMICILDGIITRQAIAIRRKREFRDEEYVSLENMAYITHDQQHNPKAERHYTITPIGKEKAEKWKAIMTKLCNRLNATNPNK